MKTNLVILKKSESTKAKRATTPGFRGHYRWLGHHLYSGGPGLTWQTEFWVRASTKAMHWELYCRTEQSGKVKQFMGYFTYDELTQHLESIGMELEKEDLQYLQTKWFGRLYRFQRTTRQKGLE